MNWVMTLFTAALFVVLVPGVFLSLPPKSTLLTKAVVHGLVFAVVYYFAHKALFSAEGFKSKGDCDSNADCEGGNVCWANEKGTKFCVAALPDLTTRKCK